MASERPLYFMIKPPPALHPVLRGLRASHGIDEGYALDRLHSTFLRLGDAAAMTAADLDTIARAAGSLMAEPFPVVFDTLDGNLLKGGKGLREASAFQRALARRVTAFGFALPPFNFWLHLSLAYTGKSERRAAIPPLGWQVEELLLIESIKGEGRHVELGRWPLARRQFDLAL